MTSYDERLAEREALNYASTRRWNPRPNVVGMIGERELARFYGVPQDLNDHPAGDGGADLIVPLRDRNDIVRPFKHDVKSSAKAGPWLLVNVTKVWPQTIYVLAHVDIESDSAKLIGWEWSAVVRKAPTRDWGNNGVIVHYIHRDHLRGMQELLDRQVNP